MNRLLKGAAAAAVLIAGLSTLPADDAQAFWGGWWPWNWGDWDDGPGYWHRPWGWGGYPGYWGGYPGYGWGGYPGYGWGGYPYYGGWGGYPAYGWGYPGYAAPLVQALPPEPKPADTKSK